VADLDVMGCATTFSDENQQQVARKTLKVIGIIFRIFFSLWLAL
jgi:hypothetical protein